MAVTAMVQYYCNINLTSMYGLNYPGDSPELSVHMHTIMRAHAQIVDNATSRLRRYPWRVSLL